MDEKEIEAFNKEAYPRKRNKINTSFLRWKFRIGYNQKVEPIYLKHNNRIVGQAGLQPIIIYNNGKRDIAIWFNNFIILPEMRGKKLGTLLAQNWMKLAPLHITNCNNNSWAIFKKLGWNDNFITVRYALPINIKLIAKAKDWTGLKTIAVKIFSPFYSLILKVKYSNNINVEICALNQLSLQNIEKDFRQNKKNYLLKDADWLKWRLLDSHDYKNYYRMEYKENVIYFRIVKTNKYSTIDLKRLHILYQSTNGGKENRIKNFKALISYSITQNIDLLTATTNIQKLKKVYSSIFINKLPCRFAYHSKNSGLMNSINSNPIPLQSIDSDFDLQYF